MSGRDLHLPSEGAPRAAAVVLHPHPSMGGNRHHPLVVAVAEGLAACGVAVLRPDLPDPDTVTAARELDLMAQDLVSEVGVSQLMLVGYSWGSIVTVLASVKAAKRVLVAPPVSLIGDGLAPAGIPTLVLVPAHDQYGPPDAVHAVMADWPATTIEIIDGTDHFLAGAMGRIVDRSVGWLTTD